MRMANCTRQTRAMLHLLLNLTSIPVDHLPKHMITLEGTTSIAQCVRHLSAEEKTRVTMSDSQVWRPLSQICTLPSISQLSTHKAESTPRSLSKSRSFRILTIQDSASQRLHSAVARPTMDPPIRINIHRQQLNRRLSHSMLMRPRVAVTARIKRQLLQAEGRRS